MNNAARRVPLTSSDNSKPSDTQEKKTGENFVRESKDTAIKEDCANAQNTDANSE